MPQGCFLFGKERLADCLILELKTWSGRGAGWGARATCHVTLAEEEKQAVPGASVSALAAACGGRDV
jgi:hypothetical protein